MQIDCRLYLARMHRVCFEMDPPTRLLLAASGPRDRAAKGLTAAPQPALALGSDAAERSMADSASLAAAPLAGCPVAAAGPSERDAVR
jgi:hypothetical protein